MHLLCIRVDGDTDKTPDDHGREGFYWGSVRGEPKPGHRIDIGPVTLQLDKVKWRTESGKIGHYIAQASIVSGASSLGDIDSAANGAGWIDGGEDHTQVEVAGFDADAFS